jgi:hypothetical protein
MIPPEDPPGFVVRTELQKAAFENGFRLERGTQAGWLRYGSTTVTGDIWLAGASMAGPWLLSIGQQEIAAEMKLVSSLLDGGPGSATFVFENLQELYEGLDRAYRLGASLPDAPLRQFRAEAGGLPRETEAERLVVQRIGQNVFREALIKYWNGRCPLTGITDIPLLRASHIVPWAECETDFLRLDVHNGLLLSALWDACFDSGKVSFGDDGSILRAPTLSAEANASLGPTPPVLIGLTDAHRRNLLRHRRKHGFTL